MTPEEQSIAIARMDENIGFIREQLERGVDKFKEIDAKLEELDRQTASNELASDVKYLVKSFDELKTSQDECKKDCNKRILKLEKWQAYIIGVAGAIAFIISIVDDWVLMRR